MNKNEFIAAMEKQLLRLPKSDRDDILNDFETHFARGLAEGKTEEDVSAELGDPAELAAVYLENLPEGSKGAPFIPPVYDEPEESGAAGQPCPDGDQTKAAPAQPIVLDPPESRRVRPGGIVGTVFLSFLALTVLYYITCGVTAIFGVSIASVIGAVASFAVGVICMPFGVLAGIGFILLSIALVALCVLLINLGIICIKGVIRLVKWFIGLCIRLITGGNA